MPKTETRVVSSRRASHLHQTVRTQSYTAAAPAKVMAPRRSDRALAELFGITESNLARRREFIRLGEEERQLIGGLVDWATRVAGDMAREFYDFQFAFPPTLSFFEQFAAKLL